MKFLVSIFLAFVLFRVIFWVLGGGNNKQKTNKRKVKDSQSERADNSDYIKVKLLNNEEERCFNAIKNMLVSGNFQHQVFPQVSMGEVVKSSNFDGFSVTNSKRFDFVIFDKNYMPIVAIEYNGIGHYKNNWRERDQVKEIACVKSGILFFQIKHSDNLGLKIRELKESILLI